MRRASWGMLRLRDPAWAVSWNAIFCDEAMASAGVVAVILSAICAMTVPATTRSAANIIRLRITPTH
jgi:hypothetical protein